jgi:uncharacterized protein YdeI (BOF family)
VGLIRWRETGCRSTQVELVLKEESEIDDDWRSVDVTPELKVQRHGEIEQERQGVELDVDGVRAVE